MISETPGENRIENVLVLENNVVIAQDLTECLREMKSDLNVVVTRTKDEAKERLSAAEGFDLAIVPHRIRGCSDQGFFNALLDRVRHVALHGNKTYPSPEGKQLLYLTSPFTATTVGKLFEELSTS